MSEQQVLVLGDGSWGTALALCLARNGVPARVWGRNPERSRAIMEARENVKYLPGVELPPELEFTADPEAAARDASLVLSVVPTQHLRSSLVPFEDALGGEVPLVSASKGLEVDTFQTPTQVLQEVLGERPTCVLTGPSHAEEVAKGLPASLVACAEDLALAERVQAALSSETLRVYTHGDPRGAELAAALKNVIALAAGICDGLELGDNAKARMHMVAEGVWTARALFGPEAESAGTSMPIAEQVFACLFEAKDPRAAVTDLMSRSPREELSGVLEP